MSKVEPVKPRGDVVITDVPSVPGPNAINVPNEPIDRSEIYDYRGNKLQYGNQDPTILGPDDDVPAVRLGQPLRDRASYSKLLPQEMFNAEETYVLPFAMFVAESIVQVDLLDERTYQKLQKQLKQRSIFTVLDITGPEIVNGTVTWKGLRLWCKEFEVASVTFKLDLSSRVCLTRSVRFWQSREERYVNVGDPHGLKDLTREKAAEMLERYLYEEGILR